MQFIDYDLKSFIDMPNKKTILQEGIWISQEPKISCPALAGFYPYSIN